MFVIVFPLAVIFAFGLYQPTEGFHGDIRNVDAFINASCECFWHIFCKLNKTMEVKDILQEYDPVTQHLITDYIIKEWPQVDEEYRLDGDSVNSDEFWNHQAYNLMCERFTDEERGKGNAFYAGTLIEHFADACGANVNSEICVRLNKGALKYYEMVERYKVQCLKVSAASLSASTIEVPFKTFGK